jgi:hypothetical protein
MQLDLTDVERQALLNLPTETIESDRYPLSPRIPMLRGILAKFGPMGPAPARPARSPTPRSARHRCIVRRARDRAGLEWVTLDSDCARSPD